MPSGYPACACWSAGAQLRTPRSSAGRGPVTAPIGGRRRGARSERGWALAAPPPSGAQLCSAANASARPQPPGARRPRIVPGPVAEIRDERRGVSTASLGRESWLAGANRERTAMRKPGAPQPVTGSS
ncbi:unnamed protein product [Rangifer tarandus platyrhynchus]|uniref:Uncharacterized protein n=1 Tax=Rangifer tarandus platyrhynchus TaxID=3082113 RepID=A0AC59ZGI3_RANTA